MARLLNGHVLPAVPLLLLPVQECGVSAAVESGDGADGQVYGGGRGEKSFKFY